MLLRQFKKKKKKDEKDYHKSWITKIYQSITVKKNWWLGQLQRGWKSCRSSTEKGATTGPWWVLFMIKVRWQFEKGISSKPKAQNLKQHS